MLTKRAPSRILSDRPVQNPSASLPRTDSVTPHSYVAIRSSSVRHYGCNRDNCHLEEEIDENRREAVRGFGEGLPRWLAFFRP